MANKPRGRRPTDAQIEAANEIYKTAKAEAEIEITRLKSEMNAVREESEAVGIIKKIDYDIAHNQLLKHMVLYRVLKAKEYRKAGMTQEQFCQVVGMPYRTLKRIMDEVSPLYEHFSANVANLLGTEFNKIRLLGRAVSANMAEIRGEKLVYDGEEVPFTPESVQAVIEVIEEKAAREKEEVKAELKAAKRVSKSKEKLLHKLEKQLERLEQEAREKGYSPEEEAFLQRMANLKTGFDGYMLKVDPERMGELQGEDPPTPRMVAALLTTLQYMRVQIEAAHDTATERYGDTGWEPGE